MNCLEVIMTRRSIRKFKPDPVKREDIMTILDAGRMAPSAGNLQPCHFVVVEDPGVKAEVRQAALGQELIGSAPVIIAVCVEPERSSHYGDIGRNYFCLLDAANATENMLLAAHTLDYGACWVGGFLQSAVKEVLGLPENVHVVSLIPLGIADEKPEVPLRRPLEDMVRWEKW
ncbi:MAG: nitroreductase family protein [Syntrophomonadaceae bacterium]|nr:nitroreductase family protein [Syntrophomonadaceae bacterium]MDD3898866.1 nitroreductase family protein [Syntrophomonadaceae bacterium]